MNADDFQQMNAEGFLPLLAALRVAKRPVSTAPMHTPKNFLEQFVIYKNGATIRLYVWVAGAWHYTALT